MTPPNDNHPATPGNPASPDGINWERIAAFADGELDAEQAEAMARKAADCQDTADCAEHQRQLRKLLSGCMDCQKTMRCPDELRRCLEDLANQHDGVDANDLNKLANISNLADPGDSGPVPFEPPANPAPSAPRSSQDATGPIAIAPFLRWGLAAALLLAVFGGIYAINTGIGNNPTSQQAQIGSGDGAITLASYSDRRLRGIINRHVRCSAGEFTPLNVEDFSTDPQVLSPQVAGQVLDLSDADAPALPVRLDLAQAGLELRLAGRCVAPGPNAMHLIYDASSLDGDGSASESEATVSLWVKAYHPDADPICTPGQTEVLTEDGSAHPVLLWRDDRFMYVLVGDAMDDVRRAQQTLVPDTL